QEQLAGGVLVEYPLVSLCDRRLLLKRKEIGSEFHPAQVSFRNQKLREANTIEMLREFCFWNFSCNEFACRDIGIGDAGNATMDDERTDIGIALYFERLLARLDSGGYNFYDSALHDSFRKLWILK